MAASRLPSGSKYSPLAALDSVRKTDSFAPSHFRIFAARVFVKYSDPWPSQAGPSVNILSSSTFATSFHWSMYLLDCSPAYLAEIPAARAGWLYDAAKIPAEAAEIRAIAWRRVMSCGRSDCVISKFRDSDVQTSPKRQRGIMGHNETD